MIRKGGDTAWEEKETRVAGVPRGRRMAVATGRGMGVGEDVAVENKT